MSIALAEDVVDLTVSGVIGISGDVLGGLAYTACGEVREPPPSTKTTATIITPRWLLPTVAERSPSAARDAGGSD